MSIQDRIVSRLFSGAIERVVAQKAAAAYPKFLLDAAEVEKTNLPRLELPKKQAELYQRLSWVAMAVGHVAAAAALVPLEVLRRVGEGEEGVVNHPFELLLKRPNELNSRYEFLEATFLYRLLTGNGYWWINAPSEDAPPTELWIIPSHQIEPVPDGRMYLKGYDYDPGDGRKIRLPPWQIVQFKRFNPFSRFVGMSPIESLATVAVGDMKMQEWNTRLFGENNGRVPGALAFADPIPDPEWGNIKREVADASKLRNMLLLRGSGAGGVNWVQMAMSQSDMEFLEGRSFNRTEIFDLFAPGLMQWLSPDTNNANSRSGRDAFFELSVHPLHTSIGETVSNNIMPRYGDNLEAQFEDVRPKDRALLLQEQQAFGQVHTIDEIREQYYQTDKLGDERGKLLPAEVGKGLTNAEPPKEPGPIPPQLLAANQGAPEQGGPAEDVADAGEDDEAAKRERTAFRRFAAKRVAEGKPEKIDAFAFDHLNAAEQAALKAEFVTPEPDPIRGLSERLAIVIETLRSTYAEPVEAVE